MGNQEDYLSYANIGEIAILLRSYDNSRDEDSSRMLDYVFENIVFDYGTVVWEQDITGPIISKFMLPLSTELMSIVDSIKSNLDAKFTALFECVENML